MANVAFALLPPPTPIFDISNLKFGGGQGAPPPATKICSPPPPPACTWLCGTRRTAPVTHPLRGEPVFPPAPLHQMRLLGGVATPNRSSSPPRRGGAGRCLLLFLPPHVGATVLTLPASQKIAADLPPATPAPGPAHRSNRTLQIHGALLL